MTRYRPLAPAQRHGPIRELFPDIYFVTGAFTISGWIPLRISRNMTIIRQGSELVLVNAIRLSEDGLSRLEQLGRIRHTVRLSAFHGRDDPFYQQHYNATVWSVDAPYAPGFHIHPPPETHYFSPDVTLCEHGRLPLKQAHYFELRTGSPYEGILWLDREGGIIISGDALQNCERPDSFYNLPARIVLRLLGFFKPCAVGQEWHKLARPDPDELRNMLDYPFEHLLPGHGNPVIDNAHARYEPAIRRL